MEITFDEFDFYGIRTEDTLYRIGDTVDCSRVWIDGEATSEYLEGTCATEIRNQNFAEAMKYHTREGYCGQYTYIIAGNVASYGEDAREIIITNAEVVAILD